MDGTVIFGKDGILRLRPTWDNAPAVPLELIQEAQGTNPYAFFLKNVRKCFTLEDGSTVGSFLLCLSPWADAVSDLTDRQVDKYIAELRKPSDKGLVFDRVEIRKVISFSREMYHEPFVEGEDFLERLNRPRGPIVWLDSYSLSTDYHINGYIAGDSSNYSASCDIHELKNVPLVLNRTPVIYTASRADQGAAILNSDAAGVSNLKEEDRDWSTLVAKGETDDQMTVLELIQVVIEQGLWHDTPIGAINLKELLGDRLASLNDDAEVEDDEVEDEIDWDAEDEVEDEVTGNQLRVEIAPGAFDGMLTHYERQRLDWDELMKAMQPTGRLSYRIGPITEATAPDDRVRGMIL